MTRLLRPPEPITVQTDARGRPQSFRWQSRVHRVVEWCNDWRLTGEWWHEDRLVDTYKVLVDSALLCLIICDRLTGAWYLERLYE